MVYTYSPTGIKRKLVRFGMDYYWKGQIVEIVGRRTVAIHSNEQTLHLYRIFTYIYSLLIEKDICNRRNISVKLLCVYVCLSSGDHFIFWISFLFLSCCYVIHTSVLSLSKWSLMTFFTYLIPYDCNFHNHKKMSSFTLTFKACRASHS